jgi:hypothetical protein
VTAIRQIPIWYWAIALLLSSYYAYRGVVGNWIAQRAQTESRPAELKLSNRIIISVFCLHDGLFHFLSSIAGFCALFVANDLYEALVAGPTFDAARSVLLVFAFLFGLIGATGQLPQLILQGKVPGLR